MRSSEPKQQRVGRSSALDLKTVGDQETTQIGKCVASVSADRNVVGASHPLVCRFANEQNSAGLQYPPHFGNRSSRSRVIELIDHVEAGYYIEFTFAERQFVSGSQRNRVDAALCPKD